MLNLWFILCILSSSRFSIVFSCCHHLFCSSNYAHIISFFPSLRSYSRKLIFIVIMLDLIRSNNNVAGRMKKTQPHELWRHHESRDIYNETLFLFFVSMFFLEWKWAWIYTIALSEALEYHPANEALVIMTYIGDSRTLLVLSTFYCVFHLFHFMRALITRWYVFNISYVLFIRLKMCAWYCRALYEGGPHRHTQSHTHTHIPF